MKKIIACFLLFYFTKAVAQNNFPAAYEIKSDTAEIQRLNDSCWQILRVKDEQWTIGQVTTSPVADKFQYKNEVMLTSDTLLHKYWFRFRLKNIMSYEANISLVTGADFADYYVGTLPVTTWAHYALGRLRSWRKKDGYKLSNSIPFTLAPQEEITVYYFASCMQAKKVSILNASFNSTAKIYKTYVENTDNGDEFHGGYELTEAFMIGFLLVTFFYSLAFFFIVKEKVYLYFALYVIFLGILRLYNILVHFFNRDNPPLLEYVPLLSYSWIFINFFLIQFIRHFFKTFIKHKLWDKFLISLAILNVVNHILILFTKSDMQVNPIIFFLYSKTFIIIPLALLITLFMYTKKADRLNKLVILGAFPLLFMGGVLGWLNEESGDFGKKYFPTISHWLNDNFRSVEASCILWFVLFFSLLLLIRYNNMRKENVQKQLDNERLKNEKEIEKNELIQKQKIQLEKDVAARTADLHQSLEDLKATQSQLIQSEKMASLGELTAGIAHEIQNPLNFVNNFSEVSNELIDEMTDELNKGDIDEAKNIATDIKQNLEKINHHGKRADAIVKGMLQHSQNSNGRKEPTDINKLADEYLRLAYHGVRAKDKSFNATLKTDFDESIGNINIIPQDIGRVILNLITNAFYAVNEKKNASTNSAGQTTYEPTVSVSTKKINNKIEIKIADNGNGIPQNIIDKIFQPFFTTKPTGQGTGLGLSLSYDIVKAHGGELLVTSGGNAETKENTTFIIQLPLHA